MGEDFRVVTGNRLELLADHLSCRILDEPLSDPLQLDVVMAPTSGVARWLSQYLAEKNGVCAGIRFATPLALLDEWSKGAADTREAPSPFDRDLSVWAVATALSALMEVSPGRVESVVDYVGSGSGDERSRVASRIRLAGRLANILDQYGIYRPDMLQEWELGGAVHPEDPHEPWQAELWREVRRRAGEGGHLPGHALHRLLLDRLSGWGPDVPDFLPPRLFVFNVASVPPSHLQALLAVSRLVPTCLYLLNPCDWFWLDVMTEREKARLRRRFRHVPEQDAHMLCAHPLVAAWGRMGRDFLAQVEELDLLDHAEEIWLDPAEGGEADTLLHAVQSDLLKGRTPGGPDSIAPPDPLNDGSVRLAVCHNVRREVEALRDHVLHLFDSQSPLPGLEPRDIVVMAPDIGVYAPAVEAVWGADGDPRSAVPPRIPFSVADRPARSENAAVEAVLAALDLPRGRVEFSAVWELFGLRAVEERFPVGRGPREALRSRLGEAGARWGLDAAFRGGLGLPADGAHTWAAAIDRLLLGVAMAGDSGPGAVGQSGDPGGPPLFQGILPLPEMEGETVAALGVFLDFFDVVSRIVCRASGCKSLTEWAEFVRVDVLDALVDPGLRPSERAEVGDALDRMALAEGVCGFAESVPFDVPRDHLASVLEGRPTAGGFLRGGVTFCSMTPLRSVPFRVVALLGMDQESFPRRGPAPSFDIMARHPRRGDRNSRDIDRYLFLETLLSARDHLYISWVGYDETSGKTRPPSAVVSDLEQVVQTCLLSSEKPEGGGEEQIPPPLRVVHRLNAFSPDYVCDGGEKGLFTYAPAVERGAGAPVSAPEIRHRVRLPAPPPEMVDAAVDDLCRYFRDPSGEFVRRRLGARLPAGETADEDMEPMVLSGLEKYFVTEAAAATMVAGATPRLDVFAASGALPQGMPGRMSFDGVVSGAGEFAKRVGEIVCDAGGGPCVPVAVDLPGCGCGGKLRLRGRAGVLAGGGRLHLLQRPSRIDGRRVAEFWVRHVALSAAGHEVGGAAVGLAGDGEAEELRLPPLTAAGARPLLDSLADLYVAGTSRALPFFPDPAWALVRAASASKRAEEGGRRAKRPPDPWSKARAEWSNKYTSSGLWERNAAVRLLFRDVGEALLYPRQPGHDPELAREFAALACAVLGMACDPAVDTCDFPPLGTVQEEGISLGDGP